MNKYFEIKPDCALYKEYFAYQEDKRKIEAAFKTVCEKFGIKSKEYYMKKDRFWIVPTENDIEKFAGMMKKNSDGEFKRNSEAGRMWAGLVKDIEHFDKPRLFLYFKFAVAGHRWKERLFHVSEKLYCSIESDGEVPVPDFATEMKASEFYKVEEDGQLKFAQ